MFTYLARLSRFHALSRWLGRIAALTCLLTLPAGVVIALAASPPDYQQGEMVRMLYLHVPAAWTTLLIYGIMSSASAVFLIWRHSAAHLVAQHSAAIATCMCAVTLITGALWGKPTWGTYWVWDARLTSMLVLFLTLCTYQVLAHACQDSVARQKACAIFCLMGAINLPIIKFSVEWWNTLHQPASILRRGGIAIDPAMQLPLWCMMAGYISFYLWMLSLHLRTARLEARWRRRRMATRTHPHETSELFSPPTLSHPLHQEYP